ncbi:hypothetical protein [Brevibacterium picturae]|uniref:Lipoprotein n=2 Tax=Brevibacterium TaxID=1696 RepID=A0A1H1T129_BRESA|nr:hypothetical protein SAMN04489751_2241 [Brevibacterium sandarakinum]
MSHAAKVRTVVAGAALLGLVLSGCSALQIRTAERDSGPVRVAVQDKAGESPTTAPPDAGIPDGMKEVSVNLGAECPVDISLAMADGWSEGSATDGFHSFSRGTSVAENDVVLITCSQAYDESPQSVVEAKKKFSFSEKGSSVVSERTGGLAAGYYWSFQGLLGPSEIFAIDQKPTFMYGARIGYRTNGRLVEIGVEMRALESDTAAAKEFEKMLPTVTIDDEKVPAPRFK